MIRLPGLLPGKDFTKLPYVDYVDALVGTGWTRHDLGVCSDGVQHVYGVQIGDVTAKPTIYLQGGIHGDEWWSAFWPLEWFKWLLAPSAPYRQVIRRLLRKYAIYLIPCLNPWGYENTSRFNANGVDINRNADYFWDDPDNAEEPKGDAVWSEAEAVIVRDVINQVKPALFVDCHSLGGFSHNALFASAETERRYIPFLNDVGNALHMNLGVTVTLMGGGKRPMLTSWAKGITSKTGLPMVTCVAEVGASLAASEQMRIGMNYLLLFLLHFAQWREQRGQRLTELTV